MSDEQRLAEQYVEIAINGTAKWHRGIPPIKWQPGMYPAKFGRTLILKDDVKHGWYRQPPTIFYEELPDVAPWASPAGSGLDPRWRRFFLKGERDAMRHVHVYDRNGYYLSIAASALMPCGTPTWIPDAFYMKLDGQSAPAGLWHVTVDYDGSRWNSYELPAVCPQGDDMWLWSATVRSAQQCGYRITPAREHPGAIIWPEQHKALGVWASHLWAARRSLETNDLLDEGARAEAISLIKATYSITIGAFGSQPKPNDEPTQEEIDAGLAEDRESLPRWRRPEWQRTIKAESAARTFYYLRKAVEDHGELPLWISADAVAYPSCEPPDVTAECAGLNTTPHQCGAMHHDCTISAKEPALVEARGTDLAVEGRAHGLRLPGVRVRHD